MMRRLLYGRCLYPLYHGIKQDGVLSALRELDAGQWAAPEELARIQHQRLARLLTFAATHVPFYQDWFAEVDGDPAAYAAPERLTELPVQTKELIRHEAGRLQAHPDGGRHAYPNSTSGSTGEPLKFLTDSHAHALRLADELRGKAWAGYRLGDHEVSLWGAPIELRRAARLRGRLRGAIAGQRFLSSFDLTERRLQQYVAIIRRSDTRLLVGYPSALEVLARHCLQRDVSLSPPLDGIISSAETLWEHQRRLFERAFGARVYNRYGSRELGPIAHECGFGAGMHVSSERLLVEIVDDAGRPCQPGQWGELLVTDLESLAMPFIRYRIGDRAAWAEPGVCDCGRTLPRLLGVEGRSMDAVKGPGGTRVGGTFWTLLLRSRPAFRRFQIVQDASGAVTVRYVPEAGGVAPETLEYFTRKIHAHLGSGLPVRFQQVAEVEFTGSGKLRLVSSEFEPESQAEE